MHLSETSGSSPRLHQVSADVHSISCLLDGHLFFLVGVASNNQTNFAEHTWQCLARL